MGADSVKARQSPEKTKPKAFSEKLKNSSAPGNLALVTGRGRGRKEHRCSLFACQGECSTPSAGVYRTTRQRAAP